MSILKEFKEIKEKVQKINKWEWIPIIGPIIYLVRVNIGFSKIEDKNLRVNGKVYSTIFRFIFFLISITFVVLFFVLRNSHGYGPLPWFFWAGLGIANAPNLSPFIYKFLLIKSLNRFEREWTKKIELEKEQNKE